MTKTALANATRKTNERIATEDRIQRAHDNRLDRANKRAIANAELAVRQSEGRKDRLVDIGKTIYGNRQNRKVAMANAAAKLLGALTSNDPQWYRQYLSDLTKFTNLPVFDRLGQSNFADWYHYNSEEKYQVPGVMVFWFWPTIGPHSLTGDPYSAAINQSLARTKEKIMAKNSRVPDWEPGDLGYNAICSVDIAAMIESLGRVIRVYATYRSTNAYLARHLISSLGWNYEDVEANIADYRKYYTKCVRRFNSSVVLPNTMTVASRRLFLSRNIFIDSEDASYPRQLYAYAQKAFYYLKTDETECLPYEVDGVVDDITLEMCKSYLDDLAFINLTEAPDFISMYQDMRAAFGDDIVQLDETLIDEPIEFNVEVLNREALHNIKTLPVSVTTSGAIYASSSVGGDVNIKQDVTGYIYQGTRSGPRFTLNSTAAYGPIVSHFNDRYFDSSDKYNARVVHDLFSKDVTEDQMLDITRTDVFGSITNGTPNALMYVHTCGTELVLYGSISTISTSGLETNVFGSHMLLVPSTSNQTVLLRLVGELTPFDWAPLITWIFDHSNDYEAITIGDMHTAFAISARDINAVHEMCVLSEFYVTDGNFIR